MADLVPVRRGLATRARTDEPPALPELHRARRTSSFEYRTTLPAGVDADKVDARLDNGLLTVRVPRPERSTVHRIKTN